LNFRNERNHYGAVTYNESHSSAVATYPQTHRKLLLFTPETQQTHQIEGHFFTIGF